MESFMNFYLKSGINWSGREKKNIEKNKSPEVPLRLTKCTSSLSCILLPLPGCHLAQPMWFIDQRQLRVSWHWLMMPSLGARKLFHMLAAKRISLCPCFSMEESAVAWDLSLAPSTVLYSWAAATLGSMLPAGFLASNLPLCLWRQSWVQDHFLLMSWFLSLFLRSWPP